MMMNSSTKQEASDTNNNSSKISRTAPSSSRQSWAAFKNPRIVRVSRTFGGKDRHSKVCTVRGLRDRRIRLSVPTAIQLYDLQERLGLSQPSKVVDWLIDATTHEIDKLPPLQIPPASLSHLFNQNNNMKDGVASNEQEGIIGSNCVDLFPAAAAAGMPFNNWELPNSNLCLAPFGNHSFLSQQNQNQLYFSPTYMASQHPTLQLISSQMKSFNEDGNKWLNSRENADKHSQGS